MYWLLWRRLYILWSKRTKIGKKELETALFLYKVAKCRIK